MFRGWFPRACRGFTTGLGLAVPGSKFMPHWFAVASLLLRSNFRYRAVSCLRVVHCNCWCAVDLRPVWRWFATDLWLVRSCVAVGAYLVGL